MKETGGQGVGAGVDWLVSAAPDPDDWRRRWESDPRGVALFPTGRHWDVLVLPGRIAGPTLDVLTRLTDRPGPVLAHFGAARRGRNPAPRMGFFVPPGSSERWVGTGTHAAGPGAWVVLPYPGRTAGGVRWVVLPDGSGTLTDPALLELSMHEAAAVAAGRARE
ncbi:bifunctional DNA primase/polymerase [Streptomyces marianii]|uniref:DNA primase/polymerase bifunctional N-terminal domain-containing protein n=1 Tax=Streptomyces marianii TaxID=1817406 RepID=A0A5R9E125_9ACTN|nr:hypothetical protein [Streptomyces marianii]TLQ43396.1 hypothetical protein FEF34_09815 [Streptomyces marianii]